MDEITAIAERHGLAVVEDNAHGLGGTYRGRPLGSLGTMATQSFHATKNIQCGEGGAIVLNDPAYVERAEIIREKGTNRSQFFRGKVDHYRWVDIGSSYLPSDLLAAFLTAQLESIDDIQARRSEVWDHYDRELATWAADGLVGTPTVPDDREHPAHLYYLLLPDHARSRSGSSDTSATPACSGCSTTCRWTRAPAGRRARPHRTGWVPGDGRPQLTPGPAAPLPGPLRARPLRHRGRRHLVPGHCVSWESAVTGTHVELRRLTAWSPGGSG